MTILVFYLSFVTKPPKGQRELIMSRLARFAHSALSYHFVPLYAKGLRRSVSPSSFSLWFAHAPRSEALSIHRPVMDPDSSRLLG